MPKEDPEREVKPEEVIAGAILIAGETISKSQPGPRGGLQAIATIKIKCGGQADLYSSQTQKGSSWYVAASGKKAAETAAINESESNAKTAVQNDIQDQWDQIECQAGCTKTPLPNPIPAKITVPGKLGVPGGALGVTTVNATATAEGTFTVFCK